MKKTYPWGRMEWLAGSELQNASSISVAKMFVLPGEESEQHRHSNCEEAIVVLRGSVLVHRAERSSVHSAGDCIVVPTGISHRLKNVGEVEAELILSYGAGERRYEPC